MFMSDGNSKRICSRPIDVYRKEPRGNPFMMYFSATLLKSVMAIPFTQFLSKKVFQLVLVLSTVLGRSHADIYAKFLLTKIYARYRYNTLNAIQSVCRV